MKKLLYIILFVPVVLFGQDDYSLSFDGIDDYVSLPQLQPSVLEPGGSSTLVISYKGYGALFAGSVATAPVNPIIYRVEVNNLADNYAEIKTYHRSVNLSEVNQEPTSESFIYDGNSWNTLIVSIDNLNGVYTLYNNGQVLLDYTFSSSNFNDPSLVWQIGHFSYVGGGTNFFNGYIDDVKIFDNYFSISDVNNYLDQCISDSSNLVYNSDFNEGSGNILNDLSGNGNHGVIHGANFSEDVPEQNCDVNTDIETVDEEQQNYSMSFDGENDNIIVSNSIIPSVGEFSVSFWANASNPSIGHSEIVAQGVSGQSGFYVGMGGANYMRIGDDWNNPNVLFPSDGQWHFYSVVKYTDDTHLYIDGSIVASKGSSIGNPSSGTFYIGSQFSPEDINNEFFDGSIDELIVWNTALSSNDIIHQMNNCNTIKQEHLVARWSFDEGSGDTVYDISGNNNHGLINGALFSEDVPEQNCDVNTDIETIEEEQDMYNSDEVIWANMYLEDFSDNEAQGWTTVNGANGGQNVIEVDGTSAWSMYSDWNHFRMTIPNMPHSNGIALEVRVKDLGYKSEIGFRSSIGGWNYCNNDGYHIDKWAGEGNLNPDGIGQLLIGHNDTTFFETGSVDWHTYRIEEYNNQYKVLIDDSIIDQGVIEDYSNFSDQIFFHAWHSIGDYSAFDKLYIDYVKIDTLGSIESDQHSEEDDELNYSMSFDGIDDSFDIPEVSGIKSLTFWANISEIEDGDYLVDLRKDTPSGDFQNQGFIWYGTPSNTIDDIQFIDELLLNNSISFTGSYFNFPLNDWVFVYIELENETTDNVTFMAHHDHLGNNYSTGWGAGYIDEICFWNHDLTSNQIDLLMNCSPNGNENGLLGYWNFNEGSGDTVFDLSGNENHVAIYGANYSEDVPEQNCDLNTDIETVEEVADIEESQNNYSLDFGANCSGEYTSSIHFGDVLDDTNSFSVGGWLYHNGCNLSTFMEKTHFDLTTNLPWGYYSGWDIVIDNNDMLEFELKNLWSGHGVLPAERFKLTVDATIPQNQWTHIVGVFEAGNRLSLYVNGQLIDEIETAVEGLINNEAPFRIGSYHNHDNPLEGGWSWDGKIDNSFFYDRSLSQTEVSNIYECSSLNSDGLMAYWDFNEGAGDTLYDISGNNNHGLINGAEFSEDVPEQNCDVNTDVETVDEEQQNYSMSFDGIDDFIDIGIPNGFDPSGSHTFMFYEKHFSTDGCNSLGMIISEYGYAQTSQGLHYGYRACEANCPLGNCFGVDFYNNNIYTESINDLSWKHWAISYNHLTYERSIYLNGDLVANDFSNNIAYAGPFDLIFGATQFLDSNPSIMGNYFSGQLDEITLWNKELSIEEVQSNIICPIIDNQEALVGYWNFNEGSGDTVYDISGNGNHGIINGEATFSHDVPETNCIEGCIDSLAVNYNHSANIDDGSCLTYEEFLIDSLQQALSVFETVQEDQDYSISFDGDADYLYIQNNSLNPEDELTISFWTKLNNYGLYNRFITMSEQDETIGASSIRYNIANNSEGLYVYLNGQQYQSNILPTLDMWHNITFTYSQVLNSGKIYLDSELVFEFNNSSEWLESANYFYIGGAETIPNYNSVNGKMNNINVWDITLSQEQIQSYMICAPTGEEEGLVGYWNFNKDSGDTVYDISGNGNHGIIYGAEFSEDVPENYDGCTDANALNYDATAQCDNGSCVYGDELVSNLGEDLSNANDSIDVLISEIDSANYNIDVLTTDLGLANDSISSLETDLDLTAENLSIASDSLDVLISGLGLANYNIDVLTTDIGVASDSILSLVFEISIIQSEISLLESQLDSMINELTQTQSNLEASIDDINVLTDSIVSLNELTTSLQAQLSEALENQTQVISIDLLEGWNIIGYTLYDPQDAVASFQEITDLIDIVKNNAAAVYWPEFGFNGIGDLIPGQGYQIKISESYSDFTYSDTDGQRIEITPTVPQWVIDMPVDLHPNDIRTLVKVVNILGQEVDPEKEPKGTVLIYLYNDATVEKKIVK